MPERCLVCLKSVNHPSDYHEPCARRFFGFVPPPLGITMDSLRELAAVSVLGRVTVTGVQRKLSLGVEGGPRDRRLTVVGLWGSFVLKPPAEEYRNLPENEDITMRMAALLGIPVVPHAMIRLACGELAFICRRIDRTGAGDRLAMEDFCQIAERLTEDKYRGSVELVGRLVHRYSAYPGLDAVDLFGRIVFSFVTGNADMHLKNYSLVETPAGMRLSPAYDLLSTAIVIPEDPEETALTINGKKRKLTRTDFDACADNLRIPTKARDAVYERLLGIAPVFEQLAADSPLPAELADAYRGIIRSRLTALV